MNEPIDHRERAEDAGAAPQRTRVFTDAAGIRWRVMEQPFSDYDRRSGMSLIFESEAAVRRIRNFPPEWFEFSEQELRELSWRT